ncbi:FtsX-like permease family protein [bacterium]|nr:MAG: FtsX-like permease family protein [bacterium]
MLFLDIVRTIWFNLKSNKGRSVLSVLGIVIGIAAVIMIISIGDGAQGLILSQIETAGSNTITIMPGAAEEDGPPASVMGIVITTLKNSDAEALMKNNSVPNLENTSSSVTGAETLVWDESNIGATFVGTTASYLEVEDTNVQSGRFFYKDEDKEMARVVVLGSSLKDDLFGNSDALNQRIKVGKESFIVVGIMKERGSVAFQNVDGQLFMPLLTAQKLMLGIDHVSLIRGRFSNAGDVENGIKNIKNILRDRHDGEDDFLVRSPQQAMEVLDTITNALKFFLGGIAAISLVVGGIGIMNIMLISVIERIREIGLRKAIGATNGNILFQFLIETMLMSLAGGIIGVLIGVMMSFAIFVVMQSLGYSGWVFSISIVSIILACSVAACIGIFFGIWPAYQAAKKTPIEALRYE